MIPMFNSFGAYKGYIGINGWDLRERNIHTSKDDLRKKAIHSPDYQPHARRNGVLQPMIFTRGGENHQYNVVCMPDDELFAGDLIDAFGEKWLVMEARADATTHKTGRMMQCNHLFRFQNFNSDIVEVWGIIDQSGYSSTVTGTNQMQKSEEQVAMYMPYNEDTAKIFVDKRLASHVGYDKTGALILNTYRVTSLNPEAESFNKNDHLLMLKAIRDVYSESSDNLEFMICDYIAPIEYPAGEPNPALLPCYIQGTPEVMLSRTRTLTPLFYQADGITPAESATAVWTCPEVDGITFDIDNNRLLMKASDDSDLIGTAFEVMLSDEAGLYQPCAVIVEVVNFA